MLGANSAYLLSRFYDIMTSHGWILWLKKERNVLKNQNISLALT